MLIFKVIIAGSRDFNDYELLKFKTTHILQNIIAKGEEIIIISGTARGADQLGERYALEMGYKLERYPAKWDIYGKRAGYLRNQQMAEVADAAIIFWDGKSRGTKHMIDTARSKGLQYRVIRIDKN